MKYVDAAYDDGTFSKRLAWCLAILLGLVTGMVMILDQPTLIIFLSLIVGVAITGKLDIGPFRVLVIVAVLLPAFYYGFAPPLTNYDWKLVLLLSLGAAIDEVGNDLADANLLRRKLRMFFLYRGYLKVLIGVIAIFHYLQVPYVIAFMSFDIGYLLLTRISDRRIAKVHFHSTAVAR